MVGFGDFLGPIREVGDEELLVGVLRGVVHPAFVADLDGFQIAWQVLELLVWSFEEQIGRHEALEIGFEAGIAFRQGEEFAALIENLSVERACAMDDARKIAAESFGELLEAFFSEREERRETQQVREDVLVGLIGQRGGRNGGRSGLDLLKRIIGRRMKAGE